jgi:tetratricopeptide (TPR) repeat protein
LNTSRDAARGHGANFDADPVETATLIHVAVEELGVDLTAQDRRSLMNFFHRLLAGVATPKSHVALALRALAGRAAKTSRSELAVRLYAAAMQVDPSDVSLPYNMGNHLTRLGRTDEAIAAYGRALAIDPDCAWALYNRGHRLWDSGRQDEGIDDLIRAAHVGCDVEGFHDSVARRFITSRGFSAFLDLAMDETMPEDQRAGFLQALAKALEDADFWFLSSPISGPDSDLNSAYANLIVRASFLADIVRESPTAHLVGMWHMNRNNATKSYDYGPVSESDVTEWYRPAEWGTQGPEPDRIAHLERLQRAYELAEKHGALDAAWMAHYMSGAIALSTLLGGLRDWPSPVHRLTVPLERRPDGLLYPRARDATAVAHWVSSQTSPIDPNASASIQVGRFAAKQFRAAARDLLDLRTRGHDKPLGDGQWVRLVEDGGTTVKAYSAIDASFREEFAGKVWRYAEPVFREWLTAAVLQGDTGEHIAAAARAHEFNAMVATELWGQLPTKRWQGCRRKIQAAYDPEVTVAELHAALGTGGLLIDYYVREVVEDTIIPLAVAPNDVDVSERYVNARAGDLDLLLEAHAARNVPADGFTGRIDELLVGGLGHLLDAAGWLVIVPFGYLNNLPFHALASVQDAVSRGAIRRITYLPSTAFVPRFEARPASRARCMFVGFDVFDDIDIDGELKIVSAAFPKVTVLRDREATLDSVLSALGEHDIAHFACHGSMDADTKAGYLQLADERLYAWDVLSCNRVPDTVLLNACLANTTERFEPTSDAGFGLHAGFLVAGASHVVGGLWEINEWSARHFAAAFYEHWKAGESAAASVLWAQQALCAKTADPYLWAPHACFGDWR